MCQYSVARTESQYQYVYITDRIEEMVNTFHLYDLSRVLAGDEQYQCAARRGKRRDQPKEALATLHDAPNDDEEAVEIFAIFGVRPLLPRLLGRTQGLMDSCAIQPI